MYLFICGVGVQLDIDNMFVKVKDNLKDMTFVTLHVNFQVITLDGQFFFTELYC